MLFIYYWKQLKLINEGGDIVIKSSTYISCIVSKGVNLGNRPSRESPPASSMKFDEGKKLQKWWDVLIEEIKYSKFRSETTTFWFFKMYVQEWRTF